METLLDFREHQEDIDSMYYRSREILFTIRYDNEQEVAMAQVYATLALSQALDQNTLAIYRTGRNNAVSY